MEREALPQASPLPAALPWCRRARTNLKGCAPTVGRCSAALFVDGERVPEPLPLVDWPRRRVFPADPDAPAMAAAGDAAADAGVEDLAYYLVEADGGGGRGRGDGGASGESGDGDGDAVVWRVWLRLPPMEAGERAVRVRSRCPFSCA